ncbi:MAG: 3'-5' exonuclease, partial [Bacteroidota bacterium]
MFSLNQLKDILFVDIETVPVVETYDELPERMQALWDKKSAFMRRQDPEKSSADFFGEKAGIYAEFAKVACISCGYLQFDESTTPSISMKSFYGEDERQVLEDFGKMLDKYTAAKPSRNLCA